MARGTTFRLPTGAQAMGALPLVAALLFPWHAHAQQPVGAATPAPAAAGAPAPAAGAPTQQDLDRLLAPIALYPDNLIAQILMASTYPLEVVEAARWAEGNKSLKGQALEDALAKQPWDPAVKALVSVPQVLKQMNDNLAWMQKLGDAFLYDQAAVLATVQGLRGKAQAAGNLKSTPEQTVKTESQEGKTVYVIESPKPDVVYVPAYNPATVYGGWAYPAYPPYTVYPPAYPYGAALAFATGAVVGAAIWGNCNWGHGDVNVNVNRYNQVNRANVSNTSWSHNAEHRKGVSYGNTKVANQYGRGSQGAQNRDQFRGREGGAGAGASDRRAGGDRGAAGADRVAGSDRGAGGARGAGGDRGGADRGMGAGSAGGRGAGDRSAGGGGGFSGVGAGASTSQASARGSASRTSTMGGPPSGGRSMSSGAGGGRSMSGGGGARGGGGGGGGGRGGGRR